MRPMLIVRPSRDSRCRGHAGDLSPPYPPRHRRRRRRQPARRSPTICATGARTCATAASRIWWRRWRRGRRLCLCRAVSQATGLSLHGQALDLRPSRACRRAASAGCSDARTDRCLRGGRLPADHRLYRCRQRGSLGLHENSAFAGSVCCPASPIDTAAGPTPSWCSARSASPRRRRRRPSSGCADPPARMDEHPRDLGYTRIVTRGLMPDMTCLIVLSLPTCTRMSRCFTSG